MDSIAVCTDIYYLHYVGSAATIQYGNTADADGHYSMALDAWHVDYETL